MISQQPIVRSAVRHSIGRLQACTSCICNYILYIKSIYYLYGLPVQLFKLMPQLYLKTYPEKFMKLYNLYYNLKEANCLYVNKSGTITLENINISFPEIEN